MREPPMNEALYVSQFVSVGSKLPLVQISAGTPGGAGECISRETQT